jgi:hypothetical protein
MKRFCLAVLGLLVCLTPVRSQTPEEKKGTIVYLRKLQQGDGGFLAAAPNPLSGRLDKSSLRATSSALRALKYFGGEVPNREACVKFVEECHDRASGGFFDVRPALKPDVFATAIGIMAVAELKLPTDRYAEGVIKYLGENAKQFEEIRIAAAGLEVVKKLPKQAEAWLEEVVKMANADGTYGKGKGQARATGGTVVTVLRLGGKVDKHRDQIVKTLKEGQRTDGGFGKEDVDGSDLETTYRVLRAFVMLKERPSDVPAVRAFVARCRNGDGGYGVAPGQPSNVSGTYFASIILHWLAQP